MKFSLKKTHGLLLIPLFFPFVGFFPGTDTQPIFVISALVVFLLISKHIKFDFNFSIAFLISVISISFRFILEFNDLEIMYVSTYFAALLTFFLIYIGVDNGYLNPSCKFLLLVSLIYAVIGTVQLFIPDFMANFVNRSVEHALSYAGSGRGVRSLTGEPAALGKVFTTLNVLLVFLIYSSDLIKKHYLALISCFIFFLTSTILSRSAYALAIHLVLIFVLIFVINKKLFMAITAMVCLLIISMLSYLYLYDDIRALRVLEQLLTQPDLLLKQGAMRRVLNVPISINNLQYFGVFGSGNSPESFNASLATPIGNLDYLAFNRNIGGFVEFILKFGVFSIPLLVTYLYMCIKIAFITFRINNKRFRLGLFFVCAIILLNFQDSSTVLPMSWFLLSYLYLHHKQSM